MKNCKSKETKKVEREKSREEILLVQGRFVAILFSFQILLVLLAVALVYEMARRSRLEVLPAVLLLASFFCVVSPFLGPSSRPPGPGGGGGGFVIDGAALPPLPAGVAPAAEGGSPLATALFVLGDSTVDSGTNNHLWTLARADRPPYGRDFDTHLPTGRFSNGRIVVDYLGDLVASSESVGPRVRILVEFSWQVDN